MSGARLWLANQLLRDRVGHHYGYNLAIADAARQAGMRPELVVHRGFREDVPDGAGLHCLFRTDFRADPPAWAAADARLLRLLESWCDRRFAADLRRLRGPGGGDFVFAQMLAPRHFLRWISWLRERSDAPTLFLHLGYRPERFSGKGIRQALESIPSGKRLFLVTDSEKLCTAFAGVLNAPVHYLPHILSYDIPLNTRPGEGPLNVLVPGNARREKGFLETVGAARAVLAANEGAGFHFTIQCHSPDLACAGRVADFRKTVPGIEWIDRPLGDAEYLDRLAGADIVLLPYHLDCYAARTSGIFAEARVAGIPVVTTRGSWAGDRVEREGGGWLAPERDALALAAVLASVRGNFEMVKTEAVSIAPAAKAEFERGHLLRKLQVLALGGDVS
jgi:glycosyltransferase involved in cell wall biosynthesis